MFGLTRLLPIVVAASAAGGPQAAGEPVVAVAYPGTPAGLPKEEDLVAIKAMGFTGVEWRPGSKTTFESLTRMAAPIGLTIVTRTDVSIRVDRPRSDLQAVLWRAVAKGARVVTLDPGQPTGPGLATSRGDRLAWTHSASSFAGQISASARLFAMARPGPPVRITSPAVRGLEVALLDGDRAWVLIATNTADTRATFVARLPVDVPAALWLSLIDGGTMSMLRESTGPRWTAAIEPGAALVFVIDKAPR